MLSILQPTRFWAVSLLLAFFSAPVQATPAHARAVARALWTKDHAIGMKKKELERACLFIDEVASREPRRLFFPKRKTGLACDIERTASPDGFMLTGLAELGRGLHKVVTKALFYGPKPCIVAECRADASSAHEIDILKQLQGCRGIIPLLGYSVHPNNTYTIYLDHFPMGSLAIHEGRRFSTRKKLAIAADVLSGLRSLHERHLVHRDLHQGNILLRSHPFAAVLIDFDKTIDPQMATDQDLPQAPRTKNPPEALIQKFSAIDRYAADIYAVGCVFYILEWGKNVSWAKMFDVHALPRYTAKQKGSLYRTIGRRYEALKKKRVGACIEKEQYGTPLTPEERFQVLILAMLSFDPKERPSAEEAFCYVSNTAFSLRR